MLNFLIIIYYFIDSSLLYIVPKFKCDFTGQMVYSVRMECGRVLAREALIEADIVSSVPESGTAAAHGFSDEVDIFID